MATAKKTITRGGSDRRQRDRRHGDRRHRGWLSLGWRTTAVLIAMIAVVAGWYWRAPIGGYSATAAAVGAHTACSCRYIGGRTLGDCRKDFEPGMEAVFLSDDEDERTVTARVPLLASETARYTPGKGCVLDSWKR